MSELRSNTRLSAQALEAGRLPPRQTLALFEQLETYENFVPIRLWPRVSARKVNHGLAQQDRLPDALAPVVSEAVLTRDGYIQPGRTLIPRDLLEPLTVGALSIGTVESQDKFLSDGGFGEEHSIGAHAEGWTRYLNFCDQLLKEVSGDWFDTDAIFTERSPGFFEVADDASAMVRGVLSLYDDLVARNDDLPNLLGKVLNEGTHRLLRRGLDRGYIGLTDVLGLLVTEIWRLLEQRSVQVGVAKDMIAQIAIVLNEKGTEPGSERLGAEGLVSALFGPTVASLDDPAIEAYIDRITHFDEPALSREAMGFARAMHDTGLVSDYHAAFLVWAVEYKDRPLVGLQLEGTDCTKR